MKLLQKHIIWGIGGLLLGSVLTQSVQPARQQVSVLPAHTQVVATIVPSHTPTPILTVTPTAPPLPTKRPTLAPTRLPLPTAVPAISTNPTDTAAPAYQAPAQQSNPSGATALCNDGTLSYSAHHRGTCSHHGGVSEWYN